MRYNRSLRILGVQERDRPSADLIWDKQVTSAVTLIGEETSAGNNEGWRERRRRLEKALEIGSARTCGDVVKTRNGKKHLRASHAGHETWDPSD